jgi:hypothetical protein
MLQQIYDIFALRIFNQKVESLQYEKIQTEIANLDSSGLLESFMIAEPPSWRSDRVVLDNHPITSDPAGKQNFIKEHKLVNLEEEIYKNVKLYLQACVLNKNHNYQGVTTVDTGTHPSILKQKLELVASQVIFFPPGFSGMPHTHIEPAMGANISGVYYFNTDGTTGNLRLISPFPYTYNFDGFCSKPFYEISPVQGSMIIWPSWLMHEITTNSSNNMRVSISFSVKFVK